MSEAPDETGNIWSQSAKFHARLAAADTRKEILELLAAIVRVEGERDENHVKADRLAFELGQASRQIDKLKHALALRESSMSWKLTAPLRAIQRALTRH